jgi:hypothetical protein
VPSYQGLLANEPSQEQIRGLLQWQGRINDSIKL